METPESRRVQAPPPLDMNTHWPPVSGSSVHSPALGSFLLIVGLLTALHITHPYGECNRAAPVTQFMLNQRPIGSNRPCFQLFARADRVIVYYRAGTSGWGSTFSGVPTALWTTLPTYAEWAKASSLLDRYPKTGPVLRGPRRGATFFGRSAFVPPGRADHRSPVPGAGSRSRGAGIAPANQCAD